MMMENRWLGPTRLTALSTLLFATNVAGSFSDGTIGEDHAPETHLIPNILKSAISGDGKFTIFGYDYNTKDGTNVRDCSS